MFLKRILLEVHKIECGVTDDLPDFKPSLRHRLAMKRIFARFERNACKPRNAGTVQEPPITEHRTIRYSIKQRLLMAALIIIFMTFLAGCVSATVRFVSEYFSGTVYEDNTQLTAVEIENSPTSIEYKYALASLPNEFEVIDTNLSPMRVYILYRNKQTGQEITLRQWVKSKFDPHYNTEQYSFEEIPINGKSGLYIDFSDETYCQSLFLWDNEDYIIEIVADLDKDSTMCLLNITKI